MTQDEIKTEMVKQEIMDSGREALSKKIFGDSDERYDSIHKSLVRQFAAMCSDGIYPFSEHEFNNTIDELPASDRREWRLLLAQLHLAWIRH